MNNAQPRKENDMEDNDVNMVIFETSENNSVAGNRIRNVGYGINVHSPNDKIFENYVEKSKFGIFVSSSNNAVIGNSVTESEYGIEGYAGNITTSGNILKNNAHGIFFEEKVSYVEISRNEIEDNRFGIYFYFSSGNRIEDGVFLELSSDNSVIGNTFVNSGLRVFFSYDNVVKDNTVNGKPLVYLKNARGSEISFAGQVILVRCEEVRVEELDMSNTNVGVGLIKSRNCTIYRNNIRDSEYGIYLFGSSENNIVENML